MLNIIPDGAGRHENKDPNLYRLPLRSGQQHGRAPRQAADYGVDTFSCGARQKEVFTTNGNTGRVEFEGCNCAG